MQVEINTLRTSLEQRSRKLEEDISIITSESETQKVELQMEINRLTSNLKKEQSNFKDMEEQNESTKKLLDLEKLKVSEVQQAQQKAEIEGRDLAKRIRKLEEANSLMKSESEKKETELQSEISTLTTSLEKQKSDFNDMEEQNVATKELLD